MRCVPRIAIVCLTGSSIVLMSLLSGCATTAREPSPSDYVFFSNDPDLHRIAAPPGVFLYIHPGKHLSDRQQFIVNPASVAFAAQSPYWLEPGKAQEFADLLRQEIAASLSRNGYEVVERPAAGVLSVSAALVDIRLREPSAGGSRDRAEYQPMFIVRITEPTRGESVVLVRDVNRGNEFAEFIKSDEAAARALLSEWAGTLATRLTEARQARAQAEERQ